MLLGCCRIRTFKSTLSDRTFLNKVLDFKHDANKNSRSSPSCFLFGPRPGPQPPDEKHRSHWILCLSSGWDCSFRRRLRCRVARLHEAFSKHDTMSHCDVTNGCRVVDAEEEDAYCLNEPRTDPRETRLRPTCLN